MRLAAALRLLVILPLAGCLDALPGGTGKSPEKDGPVSRNVLAAVPLYGGSVVVRGPRGYCIDGDATRKGVGGALVILASCETLTGEVGVSVEPAMMVVSVLPRNRGAAQPTAAGIAQSMAPKRALKQIDKDGLALVHLDAGGARVLPGGDPRYWRGGLVINGHLVGLAVYGRQGSRVAGPDGMRLIMALAGSLRAASPAAATGDVTRAGTGMQRSLAPKESGAFPDGLFPNPG